MAITHKLKECDQRSRHEELLLTMPNPEFGDMDYLEDYRSACQAHLVDMILVYGFDPYVRRILCLLG